MTPDKAFWLFITFASLVFLMGGGSRYDIDSVGPLRAISAIFLAVGIWYQTWETFRRVRVPIVFLLALGVLMAMQLVPLPHSWWSSLPGRAEIARLDVLMGLGEISRPLTLSPQRTLNSLASLIVPLAAFMLLALMDSEGWRRLMKMIAVAGVASAVLGITQVSLSSVDWALLLRCYKSG